MVADSEIRELAETIIEKATTAGVMIATAESCTGGLISGALTEIPGSSAVFDRGFITYSYEAKDEALGVPMDMIVEHGAVSEDVARAMAEGALARARADLVVAVTGIAGPDGGMPGKPVGLVWFSLAQKDKPTVAEKHLFEPRSRNFVRQETVKTALRLLLAGLEN